MARRKMFTQEQINEILRMYKEGTSLTEIATLFGTTNSHISYIANSNGLRRQTAHKFSKAGGMKNCPKCHKEIGIKGARFCPFCATDIRSTKEIAIEKLVSIRKMVMLLPENCRAEFEEATNMAIKELQNGI